MREILELRFDCRHDFWMRVPGVQDTDAAREIDVASSTDIPEARAFGFNGVEGRQGADAAWDLAGPQREEFL